MKGSSFLIALILLFSGTVFAQVGINTNSNPPDPSAGLDVNFNDKGLLPPRMTFEQRNNIVNPAEGLLVYCSNCNPDGSGTLSLYQSGNWINLRWGCDIPYTPITGTHIPDLTQIVWNWNPVPIAAGYKWNSSDEIFTATDIGSATTFTETGLSCWHDYVRYVWAYNGCGQSTRLVLYQSTTQVPFSPAPAEGSHVASNNQITWNWNPVAGATGYRWNTIDNYPSSTDMGTTTTKTETGLTCNTNYIRYVWAYNSCGHSIPVALTANTSGCTGGTCGQPIIINHVAGDVAPVSKTVTYGTVTNMPGEPSKCWITSNLGSDHQAAAVDDATEESAGWYWQFNSIQGYMHNGTTRTPNTAWITSISEDFDWQSANDPCRIEIGNDWRLPTSVEWYNVNATNNWTNWNGPWNSGLKLHAAGFLDGTDGSLVFRGSTGNYWSSSQYSDDIGMNLNFESGASWVFYWGKVSGFSLRCLRDDGGPGNTSTENFTNYPETSGVYNSGTFLGMDGSSWEYSQCRGDSVIIAPSPTLGKARNPTAKLLSGTIHNGCGTMYFDYKQPFTTVVNLNVFVNGTLVKNVTSVAKGVVYNSGPITVNVPGDFTILVKQADSLLSGQVTIDNISWTSYSK